MASSRCARTSGPRPIGAASAREIYDAALEQFAWADAHGFDSLVLSEHHGVDDGWMPAPLTMARRGARAHRHGPAS